MMMLIHRICMAFRGLGKFISVAREMSVRAAMLLWSRDDTVNNLFNKEETVRRKRACLTHVLSWKRTKFLMLL